jgi:hypothetical protein
MQVRSPYFRKHASQLSVGDLYLQCHNEETELRLFIARQESGPRASPQPFAVIVGAANANRTFHLVHQDERDVFVAVGASIVPSREATDFQIMAGSAHVVRGTLLGDGENWWLAAQADVRVFANLATGELSDGLSVAKEFIRYRSWAAVRRVDNVDQAIVQISNPGFTDSTAR